jgi:transcriptional regulator with XRE-family HTH domain
MEYSAAMELKDILAIRLRALMDARPELDTQTKLHKRTGLSQSTVQRVLTRQVHTGLDVLESLAKAFKVDPLSLIAPIKEGSDAVPIAPSTDELTLLKEWRKLDEAEKHTVIGYIGLVVARKAPPPSENNSPIGLNSVTTIPAAMVAAVQRASSRPPAADHVKNLGNKNVEKERGTIARGRKKS